MASLTQRARIEGGKSNLHSPKGPRSHTTARLFTIYTQSVSRPQSAVRTCRSLQAPPPSAQACPKMYGLPRKLLRKEKRKTDKSRPGVLLLFYRGAEAMKEGVGRKSRKYLKRCWAWEAIKPILQAIAPKKSLQKEQALKKFWERFGVGH